jgi:hypothetical protein
MVFGLRDCQHRIRRQMLLKNSGLTFPNPMAQKWKFLFFGLSGSIRANYQGSKYWFRPSRMLPSELPHQILHQKTGQTFL